MFRTGGDEAVWMRVGMVRRMVRMLWIRAQSGGCEKSRSFNRDFLAIGGSRGESTWSGTYLR
jgi:hypothetical protein